MATMRVLRPVRSVEEEMTRPGPGLAAGSVLGCGYGQAHHCHWLWWGEIGRYVCSACQTELHAAIPKASLKDLRLL